MEDIPTPKLPEHLRICQCEVETKYTSSNLATDMMQLEIL